MTASEIRKQIEEELQHRVEEEVNKSSLNRYSVLDPAKIEGINIWNPDKGEHLIDIIPYIAGENDPLCKPGRVQYKFEYWVHRDVGTNEVTLLCPKKTYGKPCPICEDFEELKAKGIRYEKIKSLRPMQKVLYNIVCYDTLEEEKKGVQIWEAAYWISERHFMKLAKHRKRGSAEFEVINFASISPDKGRTIVFEKEVKGKNVAYVGHRFERRDYEIEDEILDQTYQLDSLIHIPSYEQINSLYTGEEVAQETDTAERTTRRQSRVSRARRAKNQEAAEEKPTRSTRRRARGQNADDEAVKEMECPEGHTFGADCDTVAECEVCKVYEKCAEMQDKLLQEQDDVPF